MKLNNIQIIRIIALFSFVFFFLVKLLNILEYINQSSINKFICIILDFLVAILLFTLILKPFKTELLGLSCLSFYIDSSLTDVNNNIGILMLFLCLSIFESRGYFYRKRKNKIIITLIFICIMQFQKLRYGFNIFLDDTINFIAFSLLSCLIYYFAIVKKINDDNRERTLNLAQFNGLKKDDIEIIVKALENKSYKIISYEIYRAEGTVRNRLNKIYDILGVNDRIGLLAKYSGYNIIFE